MQIHTLLILSQLQSISHNFCSFRDSRQGHKHLLRVMSRDHWQPWAGSTSHFNQSRRLYFGDLPNKLTYRGHPFPRPGLWLEFYGPRPITLPKRDLAIKLTILPENQVLGSAYITGCLPDFPHANLIHSVETPDHPLTRSCVPVCGPNAPNPCNGEKNPEEAGPEATSTQHDSVVRSLLSII
jgi:hypothetical protein